MTKKPAAKKVAKKAAKPAPKKATKRAVKAAEVVAPAELVTAYKGFGPDMQCRGYQFEVGKTYTHPGNVEVCESGFHACLNPLDIWNYYPLGCPIAEVTLGGNIDNSRDGDSKVAAASITISAELKMPQIIAAAIKWIFSKATEVSNANAATTGDWANAATTGNWANAATTGNWANAATTGNWANAATTGYKANAATTGYKANAATTGDWANAATTGEGAVAAALGVGAKAKAGKGGAIALVCRDEWSGALLAIRASKVGENGIKPDVYYTLNSSGEFVEAV